MNYLKCFCVLLFILFIAGCSTFDVADHFEEIGIDERNVASGKHVNAYLYGYYLFGEIPIVAGDPDNPGECIWFTDTISKAQAVGMLTKQAKELGCDVSSNISTQFSSTGAFSYWIVYFKDSQASGNIIKTEKKALTDAN